MSAAGLLVDVLDQHWEWESDDWNHQGYAVSLVVPFDILDSFDEESRELMRTAFQDTCPDDYVGWVRVVPARVTVDWRAEVRRYQDGGVSNHASLVPIPKKHVTIDRLNFRDMAEAAVYKELKRVQETLPEHETLTIVPNCSARVLRHTWEPDFVVTYKGRVGVIEVDGTSHHGRREADKSKERIYENGGFAYVDRFDVRECENTTAVPVLVARFLSKLQAS